MKTLKTFFIFTTLNSCSLCAQRCLPKGPLPESSFKGQVTLDDAIAFAHTHRSSLSDRMFSSKSQRNNALAALSGYLPQIGVTSRFLSAKDRALPKNQQYIYFDQLLFSFAGPVEQYRIEKVGSHIADLAALFHRDEIRYETENAFFNLYLLQTRIAPVSSFEISTTALLQKAELSNNQGLLNSFLIEKERGDYRYALSNIFKYEEQVTISKTNITKALEAEQPFVIDMINARFALKTALDTITHLTNDELFFKEAARNLRKDLAIKDQEIKQLTQLKQFQEKSYLPSASLYASIETGQPALAVGLRQLPGNFWQAGIQFHWNFDGLGNVHRAAAEEASLQAAIFAKRDKELSIEQEVSNAYHELQQLKKELDANCSDQSPEELFLQQKNVTKLAISQRPNINKPSMNGIRRNTLSAISK